MLLSLSYCQYTDKPNVTVSPTSYTEPAGTSFVTINCAVSSDLTNFTVAWQQIVNGQSTTIDVTNNRYTGGTPQVPSLTIFNLVSSDTGHYVCSAANAAGNTVGTQAYLNVTGSE